MLDGLTVRLDISVPPGQTRAFSESIQFRGGDPETEFNVVYKLLSAWGEIVVTGH